MKRRRDSSPQRLAATSNSSAAATRENLLEQALTQFSERGYAATGIRDIIQAAGVTQPTLYYHFADKISLFQALIERYYGASQEQLETIVASVEGCELRLRTLVRQSFAFCVADARVPRLMFQTYFGPRSPEIDGILDGLTSRRFRLMVQIMRDGIERSELASSDADFLALCFCCLMDQPINLFSRRSQPKRYLTVELANALVTLFLQGASRGQAGHL